AQVDRPSKIEEGGAGTITFLANPKYEAHAYTTDATILLVSKDFEPSGPVQPTLIRVADVYASIAFLLNKFGEQQKPRLTGISPQSSIHPEARIGADVAIGPFVVVEAGAVIGDHCQLHAQVYVGAQAKVGAHSVLYPGVKIHHDCEVGQHCTLLANAVIGSDGFGFAPQQDGSYQKIAQLGAVILEDAVEIGANTVIDRATMGATRIRQGVKLDNLIQIAHNVEIGENTVIAAQAGIAGSTKLGKNCRIGGQAGFVGHIEVADGTMIQAQSGVAGAIKQPDQAFYGSPAIAYGQYLKSYAVFKRLPDLYQKIRQLEKKLRDLAKS
ncbi:MAG: UDP-3-O-(3-hydroxymyristoyl)glucosamine N-acyltransferase, partial [Bacteroidota bacterium]